MYNYEAELRGLENNIDMDKNETLVDIQKVGKHICSLTRGSSKSRRASSNSAQSGTSAHSRSDLHQVQEQQENVQSDVFDKDDVLEVLEDLDCDIFGIVYDVGVASIFTLAALT